MSVTSGFFNSLSGDRKYDAIQISSMFDGLITDGIYNGYLESFMVTASSPASMVVTVGEGRCWFNHTWTLNDAPLPLTLDVGDVVLNRIDTIVIDVDSTDTVRACTIKVIKGTPSSQAVRPTLENTETHHQYPLCDISVPAGATTVTQSNITNRRGTSDCPFVATLMESVDVDDLLIQWESQWNDWMTDRANAMDSWTAEQQEAFTTWFQTVQDILDENTAGNLLNRINHRTGINATATYSAGVVAITAPDDAGEILTFVAPSDFLSSDTYTLNGEALTITDLNGEALDDSWKKNSPVTITVSGGKAFFKAGGGGKLPSDLAPLCPNFRVERNGTKVKISADKIQLNSYTDMVSGGVWAWGKTRPTKPTGENTKQWTRAELINTPVRALADGSYDLVPEDPALSAQSVSTMAAAGTPVQLSELTEGDIVKINESGNPVDFYVTKHDYESGLNGSGRTLVVRKDCYDNRVWDSGDVNAYAGSDIDTWFNGTYKNMLDADIRSLIGTTKIRYTPGNGNWTVGTLERAVFALSATELGQSESWFNVEGSALPIANTLKVAHLNGSANTQWTRSPYTGNANLVIYLSSTGNDGSISCSVSYGSRPAFTLPGDAYVTDNGDGTYTFIGNRPTIEIDWPESEPLYARQWVYNEKGVYQTMLLGGIASTEDAPAFELPTFTGNHAIFGDENSGRIELYESGELTLGPGTYDFFLVGGGGSGQRQFYHNGYSRGGGGGGGYTKTILSVFLAILDKFEVQIGSGGAPSSSGISAGSKTSIVNASSTISYEVNGADGLSSTDYSVSQGGNGGSGGGAGSGYDNTAPGYDGGSDGGNGGGIGISEGRIPGTGQGSTTRMFGEKEAPLYAGGGGGAGRNTFGNGGSGGGGTRSAGTPNTGGGGAGNNASTGFSGGSGIMIIRWNNT